MADLERLFAEGVLVRPSDREANLVHLVRAIYALCGVQGLDLPQPARQLIDQIGPAQNLVFILLDGLGMNLVNRLPAESFLMSHLRGQINATCPSTTAAALTTVTTGMYASQHGVTGWFTYLPQYGLTAMMLPFSERGTNQPLVSRGIRPQDILPPPLLPRMTHRPLTLVPTYIANTPYNIYSRGETSGQGYEKLPDAIDHVIAAVITAKTPAYVHLYLHDVDTLCHHVGVNHDSVVPLVLGIDAELERLEEAIRGRARIVITADHGLIDVPKPDQALLFSGDPLLEMLLAPPTGDARMPIFHLKEGQRRAFVELFEQRYGDRMVLLDIEQVERIELLGPGKIAPAARRRFGDFIAFPDRAATIAFHPPGKPPGELYLAVHGGLSTQEMKVPLCIV
ncbi:MAG TPA: alkaline phosphatase family protein [Tepidisphaeraceae bacterium]|nr:alkaline phosphatase family protein [Tepidisphaeraceae bacterium]